MRLLPELTDETRAFWTGGLERKLIIMACQSCGHRIHPPQPVCPKCSSDKVEPVEASGRGTIYSFTINHQKWTPDLEVPYLIAVVELEDQPGVRITAQIRDSDLTEVTIGAEVQVDFEPVGEIALPFFRMVPSA